MPVKYTPL